MKIRFAILVALAFVAACGSAQIQLIGSKYNVGLSRIEVSKWDAVSGNLIATVPTTANGIVVGSSVQDAYSGKYYFRSPIGLVNVGFSPDTTSVDSIVEMASSAEIDMANGKIFAIKTLPIFDSLGTFVGQRLDFLEYNLSNSTESVIGSIQGNSGILAAASAYNSNSGDYYFLGYDSLQGLCIYDIATRAIQFSFTKVPLNLGSNQVFELEYDNQYDVLYTLGFDSLPSPHQHVQIHSADILTGNLTLVGDFQDLKSYTMGSACFDHATSSFIFYSMDTNNVSATRIYATLTNTLVSGPLPIANMSDFQCDNTAFAAAKYGANAVTQQLNAPFSVYPNPAHDRIGISFSEAPVSFEIMNVWGQTIGTYSTDETKTVVYLEGYPRGVYYLRQRSSSGKGLATKFLVE